MSSSLFNQQTPRADLRQIIDMIKGNPEAIAKQMYQTNPQFREFVEANKGLSLEQLSQKYGIPLK